MAAMCISLWYMWLCLLCGNTQAEFTRLSSRTVTTKYGALKGYIETPSGRHLQPVEVFLGVPYATPPTGPMRFMPPGTPVHWRGVRMADRPSPVCPQRFPDIRNESEALKRMPVGRLEYLRRLLPHLQKQSEDCLYLNIYTPAVVGRDAVRLPVMMFIHGESYEWNAGNPYDGTVLASYGNVVVVTVNYRLGILGFLPAMENSARGNNGLMDQVAALHWIQGNIAEFGGDPRNVTVFGHGTGAAFVNLLMLTPMARGLFQRAIMMSGSALSPWALARDSTAHTLQVATSLGCPPDNQGLVECLRVRPAADLLRAQVNVPDHLSAFGPTVDGIVLAKEPQLLMEDFNTQYRNYDVMMGVSRLESYFFITASEEKYGIEVDRRDRILRTLVRNLYSYHQQEIFLTIVNEYTDWTRPFQHPMNILDGTSEAVGDALVVAPLIRAANLHAQVAPATFLYVFAYQSEAGDYPSRLGCIHGEELAYMFGAPLVTSLAHFPRNYSKAEQSLSEATMTFWTNFVKYGDPSYSMQDSELHSDRAKGRFERLVWPPYEASHQKYLLVGMKPKVKDHYHAHRLSLWLHLIPQLHRPGGPEVGVTHHLLDDHDNPLSYDGTVRSDKSPLASSSSSTSTTTSSSSSQPSGSSSGAPHPLSPAGLHPGNDSTRGAAAAPTLEATPTSNPLNLSDSMMVLLQYGGYSTALGVTIAVGCSLLILNVLIFAGVYYQRDKTKLEAKLQKRNYKAGMPPDPDTPSTAPAAPSKQQLSALRAPPPSPVGVSQQQQQGGCCGAPPPANDPRMVAATLPPKVPPKVTPPQPRPLPEAQPLLAAQGTATLGRIRLHHANKLPDGIVEMPMAEFDEAPPTPHHPQQQQESVCIMQWRKPL